MNLLDADVWLAGIWSGHSNHARAAAWRAKAEAPFGMCRLTQMAVLRHLTNPAVMGTAAQTRREAWTLVARQLEDPDVVWLDEPANLEQLWRTFSARDDHNHKLWTDDYLAAFALGVGATLITLDRALAARYPSVNVVVI